MDDLKKVRWSFSVDRHFEWHNHDVNIFTFGVKYLKESERKEKYLTPSLHSHQPGMQTTT